MDGSQTCTSSGKDGPPAHGEAEWNTYYNNVHVADRLPVPGFLSARRFIKVEGIPKQYSIPGDSKYLALYDLVSRQVTSYTIVS
jgi:hypothetical protein